MSEKYFRHFLADLIRRIYFLKLELTSDQNINTATRIYILVKIYLYKFYLAYICFQNIISTISFLKIFLLDNFGNKDLRTYSSYC